MAVRSELLVSIDYDACSARFVDANGASRLTYQNLTVFDAEGRVIDAAMVGRGQNLKFVIYEATAKYPLTIDPVAQTTYIKASNTDSFDSFGRALAISGNTIVVGAPSEDSSSTGVDGVQSDNSAGDSGAAYVFVKSGSTWVQEAYLKASNTESGDAFGSSVAIRGDTLVIAAGAENSSAVGVNGDQSDNSAPGAGAAYIFVRTAGVWTQQAYLKASNTEAGDFFGSGVAIEPGIILVGALQEDSNAIGVNGDQNNNFLTNSGAVYEFNQDDAGTPLNLLDDSWSQGAYLKASNNSSQMRFGFSVSISGNTAVVGAPKEGSDAIGINGDGNNNNARSSGAAFVFVRSGNSWSQEAYFKASNADTGTPNGDEFGRSVSISGNTIVVGAWMEDSSSTGVDGSQSNGTKDSGAAYVFERTGSSWTQSAYLKASNTDVDDFFGRSVAISNDTIVVGAERESSGSKGINGEQGGNAVSASGAAYLFERNGTKWRHLSFVKPLNTHSGGLFGLPVAISGEDILVGATGDRSSATGINGPSNIAGALGSGAAHVFKNPPGFSGNVASISLSAGGQQVLDLDEGTASANWFYWVFGSVTGSYPGIKFGGEITLPLNFDVYMELTFNQPGHPATPGFGQLDAQGRASTALTLPAGLDPSLAGVTMHHAYLTASIFGVANFASSAVPVLLVL